MTDTLDNTALTQNFEIHWNGIAPLLEESFENEFPPLGWTIIDETQTWFIWSQVGVEVYEDSDGLIYTVIPKEVQKQAMVGWDYQENKQDEWLITPEVEITVLADLSFETFAQYGSFWYDNYIVGISTDGINWDEVWNAFYFDNSVNQCENRVAIPLDNYLGQTIRVSWRAYNALSDNLWYSWFIDDVKIEKRTNISNEEFSSSNNSEINVFPNPASDFICLNSIENMSNIQIFNNLGEIIFTKQTNSNELVIDIKSLFTRIYVVKVETENKTFFKKIIIQN
jgi:hypothetical protein